MAHKKAQGSTTNGRDSQAKRLGVKIYGGQPAKAGAIIIRQRGTAMMAGENVRIGRDHTLFATLEGVVYFQKKNIVKFDGNKKFQTIVHVQPVKQLSQTGK